ncbi:abc transporter A family member 3 ame [Hyphodiscus hymeniophilus]|uniref:Abc transporter A family member 3 ame n=1 Tax=Hyphodiscus hymeniophilus TaxID=353542 RepID=A0A9P7B085_9HELO|nr:abc transporter A family member 3 ame [Hyphodiscus hymeniophilus]
MALLHQSWTLTRKNILIAAIRHAFSTSIRAFILPIAFMIFLSYARNLFIPPSNFGVGSPRPIRTLAEGLDGATGGHKTLAFVNNGFSGGDIDRVIDTVVASADGKANVVRLSNETALLDSCKSSLRGSSNCYGAIVFRSSPTEGEGGFWNYTLRADGALGEKIDVRKGSNDVQIYLLPLQRAVDYAIAGLNTSIDQNALPATVLEYPYTSETQAQRNTSIRVNYQGAIINILGIAFLIGMVGVTYHLTGFIASERELGMSQLVEAMMPNLRRWEPQAARIISYHLSFDIIYAPGWILMGIVLGVGVFQKTNMAVVVIYHLLAGLSLASFSIFGASFFKKAQLSGITLALTTLLLGVVAQVVGIQNSSTVGVLSFLFVPCNYVFFIIFMARYERQDLPTDLVRGAPKSPWQLPGIAFWIFLIIQIFVYPLLGAWVERCLYGTTSKGRTVIGRALEHATSADEKSPASFDTVQLQNFTKHYRPNWFRRKFAGITKTPKATVVAVNNLTLNATRGQIFVLLGANGSGKSTTLDAIAGLNTVTSGTITVDGTGGLGIAPQKNVLWDELTVEEHIQIFNRLKSTGPRDSRDALHTLIKGIDLDRKSGARAKTLSGGQKRKLQLGMMFTGGSSTEDMGYPYDYLSVQFEPLNTDIAVLVLAERGTRTIILTTHFLDEADLLADRIAILSKGTLRAEGSSAELKDRLGGGYRIHLQTSPGHERVPNIEGVSRHMTVGQTIYSASTSSQAARIIRCLEDEELTDYQLSGPTIEDVFLQLADEVRTESETSIDRDTLTPNTADEKKPGTTITDVANDAALELHSGQSIGFFRQGWVLCRKRFTILRRNYLPYTAALLLPIIAAGLVSLFLKSFKGVGCQPSEDVSSFTIGTLVNQNHYSILAGPPSRLSIPVLSSLYGPLIYGVNITQNEINKNLTAINTIVQFNNYINQNFANVTPAAFFLGDGTSQTILAYKGNANIYSGVFGQNIMNVMLSNISIATQYQPFDIPWAPGAGKSLQLVVYFGLAMSAYPGFFALYPTVERTRNIRGLEYSNGVRSLPLWLAYMTFDFIIVLVSSALCVIIFAAASSVFYHIGYLFIIFALFGLASILLSYVVSLFARTQLSAFAFAAAGQAVMFLVYLIGYLCTLTYAPVNKIDDYLLVVHFTISLITPMGSLIRALFVALNIFSTTCDGNQLSSFPADILQYGGPILYLILQIFFLFAVLLWYDSGSVKAWYRRIRSRASTTNESDIPAGENDIGEELARVRSSNDGLRVLSLTKSFGRTTAVENLTFGITRGEVFALLGPNGAGKSTTISLIRGDIQPSKNGGNIFVENIEINRHRAQARSHLGVCPQFDAMDVMTVVEHLRFYARIRGVAEVEHNVEAVLKAVGLQAFSSRMAAKLSGGNKRKLSLGIALIGNPTVLLLDEPSSGMDAAAKRVMWKTLAAVVPGRSLLLTTHSMEEADALANRAGIMAKRMLAMGTSDHLRRQHGDAYFIHLVAKSAPHTTDSEISALRSWVLKHFPGADIEDKTYHGQLRFSVPAQRDEAKHETKIDIAEDIDEIKGGTPARSNDSGIGSLIAMLEDHKEEIGLAHYSVSPTTLDQVFLSIVGKHDVQEEGYTAKPKRKLVSFWKRG